MQQRIFAQPKLQRRAARTAEYEATSVIPARQTPAAGPSDDLDELLATIDAVLGQVA